MRLVRQTQAAKAQRMRDERVRSSWTYKLRAVVGVQPTLRSDTKDEADARRQRQERIKRTLFFYRRVGSRVKDDQHTPPHKRKKRWTKKARARVEKAAKSWCAYGVQVKVLQGPWKNCVGSILSVQNLFHTGFVMVYIPSANRAVVVNWEHLTPHDDDEILRQAYVPVSRVLGDFAHDFAVRMGKILTFAARRAHLLYLQAVEFHDVVQFAWVTEFNKIENKPEYWNVVLNRRTLDVPKGLIEMEKMESEERERIEQRVELAKSKLIHLLQPLHPIGKPKLKERRHAVVTISKALSSSSNPGPVIARLQDEADAMQCARFWSETVLVESAYGSKKAARRFLQHCSTPPRSTKDCWLLMRLLRWLEIEDYDGCAADAKAFFRKPDDHQFYIISDVAELIETKQLNEAQAAFTKLMRLKEDTLQLLVFNAQQQNQPSPGQQGATD
ncbi:hypothetical protein PINS_up001453 [Pythium insidiosum]|nr:hypothetical protein PINS_up001453 [Pythium insidiosum]